MNLSKVESKRKSQWRCLVRFESMPKSVNSPWYNNEYYEVCDLKYAFGNISMKLFQLPFIDSIKYNSIQCTQLCSTYFITLLNVRSKH